jgi:arabinofuranan 3-O-arabinosyltransferase
VILLVAMATGVVMVLRVFRRQIGLEHFLAGVLASFGPYSASFLLPSSLYSMAAICPWLIVAVIHGTAGRHRWRWAAIVAIIVALAANPDIPGLLYNLPAVIIASAFVVASRRATARRVVGWLFITSVLTVATSAWMLTKTYFGLSVLRGRLQESELVATAAVTSSWSESIRGLGNWLSYFAWAGNARKTATDVLLTNSLVVLATFAVPIAAFAMLALSRRRWTWFLGALAVVSLTLMVGGYGDPTPTPFGEWWLSSMERIEALSSFRNTYKAGAGLVIATSILAALAVTRARDAVARVSRRSQAIPVIVSLAIVGACIAPFATTSLFETNREAGPTPDYWSAAFEYLDRLPEQGRTLFLPATTATRYRWGFIGDDIIDAELSRPHAVATGVPSSPPVANDAVEAITRLAQAPNYQPGMLGELARRLGITEIVLRNDINWQAMRVPRPTAFDGVRTDPDFDLVAQFGDEGENTTAPGDTTDDAETEKGLPPIEVYRLRTSTSLVRIERPATPIVVAGSASSWPRIWTDAGLTQPIVSSGAITDEQLRDLLAIGSGVVITDSARMRLRVLQEYEAVYSYTVNADEALDRPPTLLYSARPAAHSFTWYPDATSISSEGIASSLVTVGRRPALAFDGDTETSWLAPWQFARGGARVRVELRDPTALGVVSITAARLPDGTTLARQVRIEFDDKSTRDVTLGPGGSGTIDLTGVTTSSLVIRIIGFDIGQPLVGLSEIRFAGIDLREHVQVPTDVTAPALDDADSPLAALVSAAPTTYVFTRSARFQITEQGTDPDLLLDEERAILRRFGVARPGGYEVTGRFRLTDRVSESTVRALAGPSPERAGRSLPIDDTCRSIGLTLTSEASRTVQQVPVRLIGTVNDLLNGREIDFTGCEPMQLGVGNYTLHTSSDATVSSVILTSANWPTPAAPNPSSSSSIDLDAGDSAASLVAEMAGVSTVVLATAFDPVWTARAGSRDLGGPLPVDALNGWVVDATGPTQLTFSVGDEKTLDMAAGLSVASIIACTVIAGAPRRRRRHRRHLDQLDRLEMPERPLPHRLRPSSAIVASTAAGLVTVLYVGPLGLVAVPVIAIVAIRLPHPQRIVGLTSTALLVAAAITSISGIPDSVTEIGLAYSRQRTLPNTLALSAVVFALHTIALRIAADRQRTETEGA